MYFRKISNKITVSRAVMANKVIKTIRLYKTSPSLLASFDGEAIYDVTEGTVSATNGWMQTPSSDSADIMYFSEAEFEYETTESTHRIDQKLFTPPQRYNGRHVNISLSATPLRNDRYDARTMQRIEVQIVMSGFVSEPTINAYARRNGLRAEDITVNGYYIEFPYKYAPDSVVIEVWLGGVCITDSAFNVENKTGAARYVGQFTDVNKLVDSLKNSNGEIMVAIYMGSLNSNNTTGKTLDTGYGVYFNGDGYNVLTPDDDDPTSADVALQVVSDATRNGPILGPVSWFNRVVANSVETNDLEISSNGCIRSGYDRSGNKTKDTGFWISGTGQMKAVGAQFDRITIDESSTLKGDVNHEFFKTSKGESTSPFNYTASESVYSIPKFYNDLTSEAEGKSYTTYKDSSTEYGSRSFVENRKYVISGKFNGTSFSFVTFEVTVNVEIKTQLELLPVMNGNELRFIMYTASKVPSSTPRYVRGDTWFSSSSGSAKYPTTKLIKKSDLAGIGVPAGGSRTLNAGSSIYVTYYGISNVNGNVVLGTYSHTFAEGSTIDYIADRAWVITDAAMSFYIQFYNDISSTETGFYGEYIYDLNITNLNYKTAEAGILTAHITPLVGGTYNVGAELTPFNKVWAKTVQADEVHGKVYFS